MLPPHGPLYDEERPETFPVYQKTSRVSLAVDDTSVVLGLKNSGLDVYFADGLILHYDLEGRLTRAADPPVQWLRGLSGRILELCRRPRQAGRGFQRRLLDDPQINELLDRLNRRMTPVKAALLEKRFLHERRLPSTEPFHADLARLIDKATQFNVSASQRDVEAFRELYHDVPILPPDQYSSLALMATDGCRYNQCTFCGFYRGKQFRAKTVDQFHSHIDDALRFHGQGLARRRSIFLGQANALMGESTWRESILTVVNQRFELPPVDAEKCHKHWWSGSAKRFAEITSFLDAFVGVRIDADEFAALRQLNLRKVYFGMESGDAGLLQWLKKPATPDQILQAVLAARQGGVHVGVIVLIGAGGETFFDDHVHHTVELIRAMQLQRGDLVYLSPLVEMPDTEYYQFAKAENIPPLSSDRLVEQEQMIRDGLNTSPTKDGPYVAHYEVANFVY